MKNYRYKVEVISLNPETEYFDTLDELLTYLNNLDYKINFEDYHYNDLIITTNENLQA